jgi:hypothetical protein
MCSRRNNELLWLERLALHKLEDVIRSGTVIKFNDCGKMFDEIADYMDVVHLIDPSSIFLFHFDSPSQRDNLFAPMTNNFYK